MTILKSLNSSKGHEWFQICSLEEMNECSLWKKRRKILLNAKGLIWSNFPIPNKWLISNENRCCIEIIQQRQWIMWPENSDLIVNLLSAESAFHRYLPLGFMAVERKQCHCSILKCYILVQIRWDWMPRNLFLSNTAGEIKPLLRMSPTPSASHDKQKAVYHKYTTHKWFL